MGGSSTAGISGAWPRDAAPRALAWQVPDPRRMLQLGLAAAWLFDAVLQFQPFMFSSGFANQMIASTAPGNPSVVAHGILWSAREIAAHSSLANASFCTIQLLLALGIAWRPTVKAALAASVVWSLGVWWIGEGLGEVLTGTASPLTGAPGAVIIYTLLAVLLWPHEGELRSGDFVAARPLGVLPARLVWLTLWASLAALALQPANRGAGDLAVRIRVMAMGEPHWLGALERSAAGLVAGRGLETSVAFAVVLGLIAVGVFGPPRVVRIVVGAAIVVAAAIWVVGEGFGGVFAGPATDPNSGAPLILLALAYWPLSRIGVAAVAGGDVGAAAPARLLGAAGPGDGAGSVGMGEGFLGSTGSGA